MVAFEPIKDWAALDAAVDSPGTVPAKLLFPDKPLPVTPVCPVDELPVDELPVEVCPVEDVPVVLLVLPVPMVPPV